MSWSFVSLIGSVSVTKDGNRDWILNMREMVKRWKNSSKVTHKVVDRVKKRHIG